MNIAVKNKEGKTLILDDDSIKTYTDLKLEKYREDAKNKAMITPVKSIKELPEGILSSEKK